MENISPIGIPNEDLKKLGISPELFMHSPGHVDTLEDVMNLDPLMVSIFIERDGEFTADNRKTKLVGNCDYVMPLGLYMSMLQGSNKASMRPSKVQFKDKFRRYRGENLDGKKILIWRFGGIGDLMFTQPIVKYLKATYPTCRIIFATSPAFVDLFNCWPTGLVDNIVTVPFNADLLDHTDFHLTFEGSIERCNESKNLDAFDIFKRMAYLDFSIDDYPTELKPVPEVSLKLYPYVPQDTIALQIRSTSPARTLSLPKTRVLVEKLTEAGYTVGFWDSIQIFPNLDDFMLSQYFSMPDKIVNLSRFSRDIVWGVSLLNLCRGFIGVDSAGIHLATALGIPAVGLYGPIQSKLRVSHYKNVIGLDVKQGWDECLKYPCHAHNVTLNQCPYLQKRLPVGCMEDLDIDEILQSLDKLTGLK